MAHVVADRVKDTSTTTGTGNVTLSGSAPSGYITFGSVMANNDTTMYCIAHQSANEWEIGLGTYVSATPALARTILIASSTGSAVSFSAGTKDVFITSPAVDQLWGTITPTALAADANDYAPAGYQYANKYRISADQKRTITGIAGGYDGRIIRLVNIGTGDSSVVLSRENAGSSAANRFILSHDILLDPNMWCELQYDGVSSRWRVFAISPRAVNTRASARYVTDFLGRANTATDGAQDVWGSSVIGSGTNAFVAPEAGHQGILNFTSSSTNPSGGWCGTNADAILIQGGEASEFIFRPQVLTNLQLRLGFLDGFTNSGVTDGAWVEVSSTGAAVLKTSNNSSVTTSSTIATLTSNTWYRCRIEVDDAAANVTAYIFDANGNQLGTQTNNANIPTGAGRSTGHGFDVRNQDTTAGRSLVDFDWMALEFNKALAR